MENPLNGVELFIGGLFGVVGFGLGDFTDRLIATHALTASTTTTTGATTTYVDTPPTTGDYPGLYNPTAICAPMDMYRWMNAIGAPTALFVVAHFIKAPNFRAALQFTAFGYGVRTVGKGVIDAIAQLTSSTALGQQLYDGELRASILQANSGNQSASGLSALPSAGLGNARRLGAGAANCAPCAAQKGRGAGFPSMPRETSSQSTSTTNTATTPTASTPAASTTATSTPTPAPTTSVVPNSTPATPPAGPASATNSTLTGAPRKSLYAPYGGYDL